jgi:pimeloyl-ACP methyl ester carboxylesterase
MGIVLKVLAGIIVVIAVLAVGGWWFFLRGPDIPYATLEAKYADTNSHFVDLPGGIHLHYRDEGNPKAPVLLLVHGFGDSFTSWDGWVKHLGNRFRIIRIDVPGHGLTRAPEGYTLNGDASVDLINALAIRLALPKFAIAGNSMGGGIAWQFATRYPGQVNALILVDAAGWPSEMLKNPPLAFRLLRYSWGRAFLRSIDNTPLIRSGLRGETGNKAAITDAFIARWAEFQRAPGHRAILMSLQPGAHSAATKEVLSKIAVPTLIEWGAIDPLITVESAHKFADAIPGSKLIVYPGIGHLPQVEIPDRSAEDAAEFLESRVDKTGASLKQ